MSSYPYRTYPYRRPAELDGKSERRKVVIVGAGIAGPTLALSLAAHGVPSIVLDDDDKVSFGSRSICQSKHTLEIWDRFGIAQRMVAKGITWEQGEVYLRDRPVWRFNLQPEPGHKFPAFVNLQQYYVEEYLYERCGQEALNDMRAQLANRVRQVNDLQAQLEAAVHAPNLSADLERVAAERDAAREEVRGLQVRAEQAEGDTRNANARVNNLYGEVVRLKAQVTTKTDTLLRAEAANDVLRSVILDLFERVRGDG